MYDLIIVNGKVIDGTGNPWFRSEVAIDEGKIVQLGRLPHEVADNVIDAKGLIVSPGFIDIHAHSDLFLLANPRAESKIRMGVTTELSYQACGRSNGPLIGAAREDLILNAEARFPLDSFGIKVDWSTITGFLNVLEQRGISTNFATLVGAGTARACILGFEDRPPTDDELAEMKRLVAETMKEGTFGITSGLDYTPGSYASTRELIELCKTVAEYGGFYATHLRGEGSTLIQSVKEAIEIGEKAGIPVQISHHKASGKHNWGKVRETLKMMKEARDRGLDVTCDVYPYTAGMTRLRELIPPWAHSGGVEKLVERIKDQEIRIRLKKEMKEEIPGWSSWAEEVGFENIMILNSASHGEYEGKRIAELSASKGESPYEFIFDLLIEDHGSTGIILFSMSEEDVRNVIGSPLSMFGTDGYATAPYGVLGAKKTHPRCYGTYPKVLGKYVPEGVLTLQDSVRKMASFPAQRIGLKDRGLVKEGMWADITIFDIETVIDKATYQAPHKYPEGVRYVIVNGQIAIENGEHTGVLAGKILKKQSRTR